MHREDKERVVAELTERLRERRHADRRRLPRPDDAADRRPARAAARARARGSRSSRTRSRAGPPRPRAPTRCWRCSRGRRRSRSSRRDGDMVAVAKALADSARETRVLEIRGGVMQGRTISAADVEELAKLPPLDVLRGQVLGAVIAPLTSLLALVNAPLQNLVGLIDARIEQLAGRGRRRAGGRRAGAVGSRAVEADGARGGGGDGPSPRRRGAETEPNPKPANRNGRPGGVRWQQLTPSSSSSGA